MRHWSGWDGLTGARVVLLAGAAVWLAPYAAAQQTNLYQQTQQPGTMSPPPIGSPLDPSGSANADANKSFEAERIAAEQAMRANAERQRQMVEDTNQLVAMANALKASVDKTTKNILSLDVMKQADEVERLAKSVKDKMRGQ